MLGCDPKLRPDSDQVYEILSQLKLQFNTNEQNEQHELQIRTTRDIGEVPSYSDSSFSDSIRNMAKYFDKKQD